MNKLFEEKNKKINSYLIEKNLDAILIYDPMDILYLTGFKDYEKNSILLISKNKKIFFTDGRFINQFNNEVNGYDLYVLKSGHKKFEEIKNYIVNNKIKKLSIDFNICTHQEFLYFKNENFKIINDEQIIKNFRRYKNNEEIKNIKKAVKIAEDAFLNTLEIIKEGITELDIKKRLCWEMEKRGSEGEAFPTIVASGPNNGASPHALPTNRKIKYGDFVTIDFGALYKSYCSDITRTIAIGNVSKDMDKIYYQTLKAKKECEYMVKVGQKISEVHNHAKKIIEEMGNKFLHSLGHGIGLNVHEYPSINSKNEDKFMENYVITIEPGIYVPGLGGVRIEDDYLVTKNGVECLSTNIPTELIIK